MPKKIIKILDSLQSYEKNHWSCISDFNSQWSLTENMPKPNKWILPDTTISADKYLVILCDEQSITSTVNACLHTNFKLTKDGEFSALFDNGNPQHFTSGFTPKYPQQSFFHSYGWSQESNSYLYFSNASPGSQNSEETFLEIVAAPVIDKAPGFYLGVEVTISSATQNAEIGIGQIITGMRHANVLITAFTYSDDWYLSTDGDGYSLVIVDACQSTNLWNLKEGWRESYFINGSPGKAAMPEITLFWVLNFGFIIWSFTRRRTMIYTQSENKIFQSTFFVDRKNSGYFIKI